GSIATRRSVAGPVWRSYPRVRFDPLPPATDRVAVGPAAEGRAAEGPATDRLAPEGPATDGLATDRPAIGGRANNGSATDGVAGDGLAIEPPAARGSLTGLPVIERPIAAELGADDPTAPGSLIIVRAPFSTPFPLSDRLDLLDATRFRLLGRNGDLVKLGGRRASLAGLTRILTGIAGVEDGIFVAPDDLETRATARLLAFVVAPDLTAEAILAALRVRIDPLFLPRRVVRLDRLPRDPLGKLPAGALARLRARLTDGEVA
ncbi:MAG: hypothetical protein ACREFY_15850, partial [Acetobacteraceae bacterium]